MNTARRVVEQSIAISPGRTEIVVFGAEALLLDPGFAPRRGARMTNDVDIIIPDAREMMVDADQSFWAAIEAADKEQEPMGQSIGHDPIQDAPTKSTVCMRRRLSGASHPLKHYTRRWNPPGRPADS